MPQNPLLVSGTVYTSKGTVPNSVVLVADELRTVTDSQGQFVVDLANLSSDYSVGTAYNITGQDEFNNEYVATTFTATEGGVTSDLYLDSRTSVTHVGRNSETRRVENRTVGNEPVSRDNKLPVESDERLFTQKIALVSGTTRTEYVGQAAPGTPASQARWRIKKLTYNAAGSAVISIDWASGNTEFDKVWSGRAGYDYS